MQRYYRLLISCCLLISSTTQANGVFIDALRWRMTETNNWVYDNSLTVPNQVLNYRGIEFNNSTGVRLGTWYEKNKNDVLLAYTHLNTTAHDSASGNLQPSFIGSVTAKPSHAYLYSTGQVSHKINYDIIDFDLGHQFYPTQAIMLHPFLGIMGGWISQTISAQYLGSTSTDEQLINNYKGFGLKAGVDTDIQLFNYHQIQPILFASFATTYLLGSWNISDTTNAVPGNTVNVTGANPRMGSVTMQGAIGFKFEYKQFQVKLAYEINDWRDQCQFFDNDTGAHNNDLILQGLTLGINYKFD